MASSPQGLALLRFFLEHASHVPDDLIAHALELGDPQMRSLLLARPELSDADAERVFMSLTRFDNRGRTAASMAMRCYRRTGDPAAAVREAELRIALSGAQALALGSDANIAHGAVTSLFEATTSGHPLRNALLGTTNVSVLHALTKEAGLARDLPLTARAALALDRLVSTGTLSASEAGTSSNYIAPALTILLREDPELGRQTLTAVTSRMALRRWLSNLDANDKVTLDPTTAAYLLDTVVIAGIQDSAPDIYVASTALTSTTRQLLAEAADERTCDRALAAIGAFGRRNNNRTDPAWRTLFELQTELIARLNALLAGCPVPLDSNPLWATGAECGPLADWLLGHVPQMPGRWSAYAGVVNTLSAQSLTTESLLAATAGVLTDHHETTAAPV